MDLKQLKKISGNEYAFNLNEDNPFQVKRWLDTGCYLLNAIIGDGDIYGGFPVGKRVILGGPSSTAKSFLGLHIIKAFLDEDPDHNVVMFESEGASVNSMAESIGIDKERVLVLPIYTVEEFKFQSTKILDQVEEFAKKNKEKNINSKLFFCLDSLGMLASKKETDDALDEKTTQDMTRNRVIKSIFRLITMRLSITQTSLLTISHSYSTQEMYSREIVSVGTGGKYAGDVILILSKAKQKEGTEHIGAKITLTVDKSRFIVEGKKVKINLLFRKGLDKYSGLFDLAKDLGYFQVASGARSFEFKGETIPLKAGNPKNVEKLFTKEVLDELRPLIKDYFSFSVGDGDSNDLEEEIDIESDGTNSDNDGDS